MCRSGPACWLLLLVVGLCCVHRARPRNVLLILAHQVLYVSLLPQRTTEALRVVPTTTVPSPPLTWMPWPAGALSSAMPSPPAAALPAGPASSLACLSIRTECMACTRMSTTSTPSTGCRACLCCWAELVFSQASLGRSTWGRRRCTHLILRTRRRMALSSRWGGTSLELNCWSGNSCRLGTTGLSSSMSPSTTPTAAGTPSHSTGPSARSLAMGRVAWGRSQTGPHRPTTRRMCRCLTSSLTHRLPELTWPLSTPPSAAWTKGLDSCSRSCVEQVS
uniref:N-sulfoglucosamine sulfohydrolase n=1 Tax=Balaenoptera musculus TaxID=9771 RepID=A0A8C0E3Y0_BALMU